MNEQLIPPRMIGVPRRAMGAWTRVYQKISGDLEQLPGRRYGGRVPDGSVFVALVSLAESVLNTGGPPLDVLGDGNAPVYETVEPAEVDRALATIRATYSSPMGHGATDDELIQFAIVFAARMLAFGKPELTGIAETGIAK